VALVPFGFFVSLRRNATLTCVLLSAAATAVVAVALTSGNIGTLVRHRDMIVPFVIALAAPACAALAAAIENLRPERES